MKKKQVIIYIVVMLLLLCTSVYATISGTLSLTSGASTTAVQQGDTFTVTVSINDIDSSYPITGLDGTIYIDPNVYETISVSNIKSLVSTLQVFDASEITTSDADDAIVINTDYASTGVYPIAINSATALEKDTKILEITLTVKSSVDDGTYYNTVKSTDFEITSGTSATTKVTDQSLVVLIGSTSSGDNNNNNSNDNSNNNVANNNTTNNNTANNNTANNNTANNNTSNNNIVTNNNTVNNNVTNSNTANNNAANVKATSTNNVVDNTVATGSLPNTGYKLVIIPVIALIILGFVFYKKYNKYNNLEK